MKEGKENESENFLKDHVMLERGEKIFAMIESIIEELPEYVEYIQKDIEKLNSNGIEQFIMNNNHIASSLRFIKDVVDDCPWYHDACVKDPNTSCDFPGLKCHPAKLKFNTECPMHMGCMFWNSLIAVIVKFAPIFELMLMRIEKPKEK